MNRQHGGVGRGGRRKEKAKTSSRSVANLMQKSTANQSQVKHVTRHMSSGTAGKIDFNSLTIVAEAKYVALHHDSEQEDNVAQTSPETDATPIATPTATPTAPSPQSARKLVTFEASTDGVADDERRPGSRPASSSGASSKSAASSASRASSFDVKARRLRGVDVMARYGFPAAVYPLVIPSFRREIGNDVIVASRCSSAPNRITRDTDAKSYNPESKPQSKPEAENKTIDAKRREADDERRSEHSAQLQLLCDRLENNLKGTKFQSFAEDGGRASRLTASSAATSARSKTREQSGSRRELRPVTAPSTLQKKAGLESAADAANLANFDAFLRQNRRIELEIRRTVDQETRAQLSKKELLHKAWTARVFTPLMTTTTSNFNDEILDEKIKEKRRKLNEFISHVDARGAVFLNDYDPIDYDPFAEATKEQPDVLSITDAAATDAAAPAAVAASDAAESVSLRCHLDDPLHLQQTTKSMEEKTVSDLTNALRSSLRVTSPALPCFHANPLMAQYFDASAANTLASSVNASAIPRAPVNTPATALSVRTATTRGTRTVVGGARVAARHAPSGTPKSRSGRNDFVDLRGCSAAAGAAGEGEKKRRVTQCW